MKCELCKKEVNEEQILENVCFDCILSSEVPTHIPIEQYVYYIRKHYKRENK